ncbi:MAG: UbiX family flavin prenyltransferase [Lachnospiraceae bacterium]
MNKRRIVVGISGASGIPVAIEVLKMIRQETMYESHLVISKSGRVTIEYESSLSVDEIQSLADCVYNTEDIGAAIASGSYKTEGMLIVPCSMKTAAGIAVGYSDSLLLRAADVVLKEKRKLVLVIRESPFSSIHLKNLLELSNAGAEILPMMMTFYNKPRQIEDMVHHIACKSLERFGIEPTGYKRWKS